MTRARVNFWDIRQMIPANYCYIAIVKDADMKRLLFILSLLFAGVCSFAQEGPAELTFKSTRFVDGASKETLYARAEA